MVLQLFQCSVKNWLLFDVSGLCKYLNWYSVCVGKPLNTPSLTFSNTLWPGIIGISLTWSINCLVVGILLIGILELTSNLDVSSFLILVEYVQSLV